MLFQSSSWRLILAAVVLIPLALGCNTFQTAYFGVEDEAIFSPDAFGKTEKIIEKAKKDADSEFARGKIDAAMHLGRQAAQAYWEGFEEESETLLALARQTAMHAELHRDQPPPQYVSRTDAVIPSPYPPNRLLPDRPEPVGAPVNQMILHRVPFTPGSSNPHPDAISSLNDQLPILKSREDLFLEIAGFASPTESDADRLSQMRARKVFNHLTAQGIKRSRMSTNAYGSADGPGQPETAARVELRLLGKKPQAGVAEDAREQYTIQVAAFKKRGSAEMKRNELLPQGYPAYTIKAEVYDKIWYRVRIGPYEDKKTAQEIFKRLKSEGHEAILLRLEESGE